MRYIVFVSYGNDSIALVQLLHEKGLRDISLVFSDTGWGVDWWNKRVERGEELAVKYGFMVFRIKSEGMESLVKRKKAWPMGGGAAFCTAELKIKPAVEWLDINDPKKDAICIIGVRREESRNRRDFPEWIEESEKHGGRELWAPMVRHTELERDELIKRAGFEVLPHRSMECFPCVHANRADLQMLNEETIVNIERIEQEMGFTKNDKPRVMFRPKRHLGATGIREVVNWAHNTSDDQYNLFGGCASGWCGE
jgi:3'-phosphoadenosine 5'-phosphosulfate sulfotransferase (PAPS reductase)/FAD synthetase